VLGGPAADRPLGRGLCLFALRGASIIPHEPMVPRAPGAARPQRRSATEHARTQRRRLAFDPSAPPIISLTQPGLRIEAGEVIPACGRLSHAAHAAALLLRLRHAAEHTRMPARCGRKGLWHPSQRGQVSLVVPGRSPAPAPISVPDVTRRGADLLGSPATFVMLPREPPRRLSCAR
jgi:hypothetical protein